MLLFRNMRWGACILYVRIVSSQMNVTRVRYDRLVIKGVIGMSAPHSLKLKNSFTKLFLNVEKLR